MSASEVDQFRDALERIALLDEADGNELTVAQAFSAVAIACAALGNKHPSQILAEREDRIKRDQIEATLAHGKSASEQGGAPG